MSRCHYLMITLAMLCAGCRTPTLPGFLTWWKKDDPAPSSAPPRRLADDRDSDRSESKGGELRRYDDSRISLTDYSPGSDQPLDLVGATVVAEVNNTPIFAGDVLEPFTVNLKKAEEQLSPEQLNRLRARIIRENLQPHIEKTVLVAALRDDIPKDKFEELETQIDRLFEDEIVTLQGKFNVGTRLELEQVLEQQGTSLASVKNNFAAREMAMFYIGQNSKAKKQYSRQELLEWYNAHRSEYEKPARVRWQQIRVNQNRPGGRSESATILKEVVAALRRGEDFDAVASRYSDGPKAKSGGHWDWTTKGSLADESVERALFEIPVGTISQPLETSNAIVLIRVLERDNAGVTPFEDVQEDINRKLIGEARRTASEKVLDDLLASASIRTIFDDAPASR